MLNELSEAAATAFQDIYDNKNGMLDDLAAFWRYSAQQFRNEPAIIGYEIMNGCRPLPVVPPSMALSAQPHSARAIRRKLLRGPDPASPRRCGQEEPRADVRGNVRGNPVRRRRSAFGGAERARCMSNVLLHCDRIIGIGRAVRATTGTSSSSNQLHVSHGRMQHAMSVRALAACSRPCGPTSGRRALDFRIGCNLRRCVAGGMVFAGQVTGSGFDQVPGASPGAHG